MTRAKYLAKDYIEMKRIITLEDEDRLITEYDKINKLGIPFVLYNLLAGAILKIFIYVVIGIVMIII